MIEQRQELELLYINDTIEDQNRIIRQINDFLLVLSNTLAKHVGRQVDPFFTVQMLSTHPHFIQFMDEPSIDLIERLQYVSNLIIKTTKTLQTEPVDNEVGPLVAYCSSKPIRSGSSNVTSCLSTYFC